MPREMLSKKPHTMEIAEYTEPPLGAKEIRVQVEYAAPKHGTELHGWRTPEAYRGDAYDYDLETHTFIKQQPKPEDPENPTIQRFGNMWVGHIIATGDAVTGFVVGDEVAGYGPIRETETVLTGEPKLGGIGAINDILRVPEDMSWQTALMYDPCQFALGGVRDSHLRLGDTCFVSGLGAIGQLTAQLAKLQGARMVIVSDPIERRRKAALENGADYALDPSTEDVGHLVKELTDGKGSDVAIECSGYYPGLQTALRSVAYGGRVAVVGWFNVSEGGFNLGMEAHMNNATLFFSRACSEPNPDWPRWDWTRINDECWRLLSSGVLKCDNLIDPIVPFEDAPKAFLDVVDAHPEKSIKMGVVFTPSKRYSQHKGIPISSTTVTDHKGKGKRRSEE